MTLEKTKARGRGGLPRNDLDNADRSNRTAIRLPAWQVMVSGPRGPRRWSRYADESSARAAMHQLVRHGFDAWVEGAR